MEKNIPLINKLNSAQAGGVRQVFTTGPTRGGVYCNVVPFRPLVRCHSIVDLVPTQLGSLSNVCSARSGPSELNVGPCHHSMSAQCSNRSKSARFDLFIFVNMPYIPEIGNEKFKSFFISWQSSSKPYGIHREYTPEMVLVCAYDITYTYQ